jgi:hypothetical protein
LSLPACLPQQLLPRPVPPPLPHLLWCGPPCCRHEGVLDCPVLKGVEADHSQTATRGQAADGGRQRLQQQQQQQPSSAPPQCSGMQSASGLLRAAQQLHSPTSSACASSLYPKRCTAANIVLLGTRACRRLCRTKTGARSSAGRKQHKAHLLQPHYLIVDSYAQRLKGACCRVDATA